MRCMFSKGMGVSFPSKLVTVRERVYCVDYPDSDRPLPRFSSPPPPIHPTRSKWVTYIMPGLSAVRKETCHPTSQCSGSVWYLTNKMLPNARLAQDTQFYSVVPLAAFDTFFRVLSFVYKRLKFRLQICRNVVLDGHPLQSMKKSHYQ